MLFQKWVLSLMLLLQPAAVTPWASTYEQTATAIAEAAQDSPVFMGEKGASRTAALLVAVAWHESRFDQQALGDCTAGKPKTRTACASWGLFQMNKHNFVVPGEFALGDPAIASREALRMVRISFRVCRGRPLDEQLAWYAAGNRGCDRGLRESRNRMGLAKTIESKHPFDANGVFEELLAEGTW